jgi:menaquinone-dependent protoporphyrinogen IX oxidase
MADGLRAGGLDVTVVDLASARPDPAGHDLIVVGGSVHANKHHRAVVSCEGLRADAQRLGILPRDRGFRPVAASDGA